MGEARLPGMARASGGAPGPQQRLPAAAGLRPGIGCLEDRSSSRCSQMLTDALDEDDGDVQGEDEFGANQAAR